MIPAPDGGAPRRRRSGARPNEAGLGTRSRLLDAAERLFAERGLDAVSVRDITEAAGANTAAIHYHFGSKVDLVAAILDRRAGGVGSRREALLDDLDRRADVDLRAVVDAMVRPTAELAAQGDGGRSYVAFLAALGDHAELMPLLDRAYDTFTARYLDALARVTPDLPAPVRTLRFALARLLVNQVLGRPDGQVHQWIERHSPGADAAVVDSLVDALVGVFQAPVTAPEP